MLELGYFLVLYCGLDWFLLNKKRQKKKNPSTWIQRNPGCLIKLWSKFKKKIIQGDIFLKTKYWDDDILNQFGLT